VPLRRRGTQARRHPWRRVTGVPGELPPDRFEDLVASALDELPAEVQRLLENVAVVIADEPTPEQLGRSGLRSPGSTLYGLYEGVSHATYGADWAAVPNKITIFRLPLEEDFPNPADLARQVRPTVLHELGPHAGLDHSRLRQAGYR
jgi:predicted Zn-dependent protease with MMP-like domain